MQDKTIVELINLNVAGYELRVTGCEKIEMDNLQLFLFFVFLRASWFRNAEIKHEIRRI